jgi:hypothetical protein
MTVAAALEADTIFRSAGTSGEPCKVKSEASLDPLAPGCLPTSLLLPCHAEIAWKDKEGDEPTSSRMGW